MLTMLLKQMILPLFIGLGAWLTAWLLHPGLALFLAGFLTLTLGIELYQVVRAGWRVRAGWHRRLFRAVARATITMIVIYGVSVWLGGYGVIGLLLIVVLMAAWRIYTQRQTFMQVVDYGVDILKGRRPKDGA